jgi:prepilin peptidase CpaA
MLTTVLLLGLMLVATATDLAWHKVYNWTTYTGMAAAMVVSAAGTLALRLHGCREAWLRARLGWLSLQECFAGLLICGVPMLLCFVLFRVGGGDVKLMAMLGAWLGPEKGLEAMLWTFVLGGMAGLSTLIWRVGAIRLASRSLRQLAWLVRLGQPSPWTEEERAMLRPPLFLAPSALAAVLIVRFSLIPA